jgi:hypothetical protein
MTTREQVIHELSKRYPYPWRVEWWLTDGSERGFPCGAAFLGGGVADHGGSMHRGPRVPLRPADNVRHFWAGARTWSEVKGTGYMIWSLCLICGSWYP